MTQTRHDSLFSRIIYDSYTMSLVPQGPDIIITVPEVLAYLHMHHCIEIKVYKR